MKLRAPAKRFASRFAVRGRRTRSVWSSCALRWRRPRGTAQVQKDRGASVSVFPSWFSQFHLHFAMVGKANDRRRSVVSSIRNVSIAQHLLERHAAARATLPRASFQPAPTFSLPPPRHRDVMTRERISRLHLHKVSPLAFRHTERTAAHSLEFRKSVHLRSTVTLAASRAGEARSIARHREAPPAFLQWRRAPHQRDVPQLTGRRSSPYPIRTPELVWRKSEKINTSSEAEQADGSFSVVSTSSPHGSFSNPPQQTARQMPPAAEMRAMVLDSATVDRLADDVIRRVERHIRIERERRGV